MVNSSHHWGCNSRFSSLQFMVVTTHGSMLKAASFLTHGQSLLVSVGFFLHDQLPQDGTAPCWVHSAAAEAAGVAASGGVPLVSLERPWIIRRWHQCRMVSATVNDTKICQWIHHEIEKMFVEYGRTSICNEPATNQNQLGICSAPRSLGEFYCLSFG